MDLVVTGAYRSGTTLLDRLLHEHPRASVVPQPLPHLWIEAKRRFLTSIGADDAYPYGTLLLEDRYGPEDLAAHLDRLRFRADEVRAVVEGARGYSGVMTPEILDVAEQLPGGTLLEVHHAAVVALAERLGRADADVVGSKEIVVEELAPWLLANGVAVVLVLRDPRGVVASLTGGNEWTGRARPTLHALRTWRKSVAFALALRDLQRAAVVRYEDLLGDPAPALEPVWRALGLDAPLERAEAPQGWDGNTSFGSPPTSPEESAARVAATLGPEVAAYVEAACWPELRALGYPTSTDEPDLDVLTSFTEAWPIEHGALPADLTERPEERAVERARLEHLVVGLDDPVEQRRWFVHPGAYGPLRAARLAAGGGVGG